MSDAYFPSSEEMMELMLRRYGVGQALSLGHWCARCNCLTKTLIPGPNSTALCPVCVYKAEQRVRDANNDLMEERRAAYRKSERAFKDFLLVVKRELDEDEFLEQCRAYYRADW